MTAKLWRFRLLTAATLVTLVIASDRWRSENTRGAAIHGLPCFEMFWPIPPIPALGFNQDFRPGPSPLTMMVIGIQFLSGWEWLTANYYQITLAIWWGLKILIPPSIPIPWLDEPTIGAWSVSQYRPTFQVSSIVFYPAWWTFDRTFECNIQLLYIYSSLVSWFLFLVQYLSLLNPTQPSFQPLSTTKTGFHYHYPKSTHLLLLNSGVGFQLSLTLGKET